MSGLPNLQGVESLLQSFRAADIQRDQLLQTLAQTVFETENELRTVRSDLDDERHTRREWKRKAEQATAAIERKYSVVLVDGDGYIFQKALYQAVASSGGSRAANDLYTEVVDYLKQQGLLSNSTLSYDVVVNVYANKVGLARALVHANYLDHPAKLDQFFCSFSQGQRLFQFIDCGPGKERADAKQRDTFRFYTENVQCQHIFLAVTHDNGYIAELDKYRYATAQPKIVLVHQSSTARSVQAYASLPFKTTTFETVFESIPLATTPKIQALANAPGLDGLNAEYAVARYQDNELTPPASRTSSSISVPPGLTPVLASAKTTTATTTTAKSPTPPAEKPTASLDVKTGVPINRIGQRIDLRLRTPSTAEMTQFETRIKSQKLCNEHHLRDTCEAYNCRFDHQRIDANMRNTLRFKARTIPCSYGQKCRVRDCFYGHVCPWTSNGGDCGNPKCQFIVKNLHDIKDLQVDRFVAAAPPAAY